MRYRSVDAFSLAEFDFAKACHQRVSLLALPHASAAAFVAASRDDAGPLKACEVAILAPHPTVPAERVLVSLLAPGQDDDGYEAMRAEVRRLSAELDAMRTRLAQCRVCGASSRVMVAE